MKFRNRKPAAGFFVVYFTGSFIKLSYEMKLPELWSGMGRAINNVFAIVTSLPFLSFLLKENNMALMVTALYRHLAGLYEKTGTRTRIGLLQFYYTWKGTKE